jgi:hypothetical protein
MAVYRERRWPWITAGYAVLFLVVAALTAFIYDSAAAESRSDVIRFAVAFVVAVILIHIRSYFRGDPRWDPPSPFEDALIRQPAMPKLDSGFTKLREEVANSRASRSYFEKVLWPRLAALARTRGLSGDLPPPAARRWLGRGPSGKSIAGLIDHIEGGR